jgi:hypothetical protein
LSSSQIEELNSIQLLEPDITTSINDCVYDDDDDGIITTALDYYYYYYYYYWLLSQTRK